MSYLLDSNVWIGLIRRTSPSLATRYQALAPTADLRVCSVVCAELWHGCARSARPATNRAALEALIAPFSSLPYDNAAADSFQKICGKKCVPACGTGMSQWSPVRSQRH